MRTFSIACLVFVFSGCKPSSEGVRFDLRPEGGSFPPLLNQILVNGVVAGGRSSFTLPKGTSIEDVKSVTFRFETPCGPLDLTTPILRLGDLEKHPAVKTRDVFYKGLERIETDDVWLDARGLKDPVVKVGSATIVENYSGKGWRGTLIRGECAAEHEVRVNGEVVGTLTSAMLENDNVFVTPKDACYIERKLRVQRVGGPPPAGSGEPDVGFHGKGVFALRFAPDIFMAEPHDVNTVCGVFEAPCAPAE